MSNELVSIIVKNERDSGAAKPGRLEAAWNVQVWVHERGDGADTPGVHRYPLPCSDAGRLGVVHAVYETGSLPVHAKMVADVLEAFRVSYRDFELELARKLWRELSKRLPENVQASKAASCADVVEEARKEIEKEAE